MHVPLNTSLLSSASVRTLKSQLGDFGLATAGSKPELVSRLGNHINDQLKVAISRSKKSHLYKAPEQLIPQTTRHDVMSATVIHHNYHLNIDEESLEDLSEMTAPDFELAGSKYYVAIRAKKEEHLKGHVGIYLHCRKPDVSAEYEIIVKFLNGQDMKQKTFTVPWRNTSWDKGWGRKDGYQTYPGYRLCIEMKISVKVNDRRVFNVAQYDENVVDVTTLFKTATECDVDILLKDGTVLKTHKFVLKSISPVFRAMFNSSLEESLSGIITIDDVEPSLVRQFVNIMYDGKIPENIDFHAMFLLADKYQVESLVAHCFNQLVGDITVENCVSLITQIRRFTIFEKHKERITRFIFNHFDEVQNMEGFEQLKKDPEILFEILKHRAGSTNRKRKRGE